jgi:phage recombination protein Bet
VKQESSIQAFAMSEAELIGVLESSLYPGAASESIKLVINYCRASNLDPMRKPVHIVPIWDSKAGRMRDVIMPGIGSYRIDAARTNQCAGVSEPEFGPDVTETVGGLEVTYPVWCRVTVKRRLPTGELVDYTAVERWKENYAQRGGKEKSIAPNTMWAKRPYAQLAKCAEAQALRKAFPEVGSQVTAEEMEGKAINDENVIEGSYVREAKPAQKEPDPLPIYTREAFEADIEKFKKWIRAGKTGDGIIGHMRTKYTLDDSQVNEIYDIELVIKNEGEAA